MKRYNIIIALTAVIIAAAITASNILFISKNTAAGRPYQVEINRIEQLIIEDSAYEFNKNDWNYVKAVVTPEGELSDFYTGGGYDYSIREISGKPYRFDYISPVSNDTELIIMNAALALTGALCIGLMLFVKYKIMKPFTVLSEAPYELAKGNLTVPLKEGKGKYFGRFVWGVDLLREKLEEQKARELKAQKEKQTLTLSISHDIKTPLGIIELYSKALEKDLYTSEEKKKEAAVKISEKCREINGYITKIIRASNEDFLELQVNNGEFYLSRLINETERFYADKADFYKINFTVEKYGDCLLNGDLDRAVEVLQNIMENAIKYGDGRDIGISFESEEDCKIISVSNSGCTLSDSEMPHIFDSFWRGSNVKDNPGSGLGLYICRQLMKKMDGDICAYRQGDKMRVCAVFRLA